MNDVKKRLTAVAAAACLCVTLLPATAMAAEGEDDRGTLHYEETIAPQYEDAGPFNEGLAAVKKNGKWGYIDTDNKTVIPFRYDVAGIFNEGYAVVGTLVGTDPQYETDWNTGESTVVGTWYTYELSFVDTQGEEKSFICDQMYDETTDDYYSGAITYTVDEPSLPNSVAFHNGYIILSNPNEPGGFLYNTTGRAVDLPLSDNSWLYPLGWQVTENTVIIGDGVVEGGNQHYLNLKTGKVMEIDVSPYSGKDDFSFAELRPFNQGLAMVAVSKWNSETEGYDNKWGVIDESGKFVIQPAYQDFRVSDVYGDYEVFGVTGLAMVENSAGKWGAIDKNGKTVIPFQYEHLYTYNFGMLAFQQNGKWGYLDSEGNVAIPAQYVQTTGFGSDGYAVAYDGTKAFLIDTQGNAIPGADKLDPETYFEETAGSDMPVVYTPDEYVVITENGKYGFGHISYKPALPEKSAMSSWAYEEVTAAIEEDLVPNYLQNLYLNNINRDEFCDLTMQAVSETMGKDIEDIVVEKTGKTLAQWQQEYPFYDSTNSNVVAAYALGIVTGRGSGVFDPYASITRQEAAAFLMRSAKVLGMDTSKITAAGFKDEGKVGVVFKDAVNFVYQINVMNGTGGGNFSPTGKYTREQSYITIYRLFQAVTGQK